MKKLLLLFFLFSNAAIAQFQPNEESGFTVDTIRLNYALVPKLEAVNHNHFAMADKINQWVLDFYGMENWDDKYGGQWGQVSRSLTGYQITDDILVLDVYETHRGSESNRKYFISLKSGNEIKPVDIPFSSLFKTDKYLPFIEEYWYEDLKQELINSYACCEVEDWLNDSLLKNLSYEVIGFSFTQDKLLLDEYRWGPSGPCWGACSTFLKKEINLSEIDSYFNDFGREIMRDTIYKKSKHYFGDSWNEDTSIEEVKYSYHLKDRIPENIYFLGEIAGKYPFKMSLNILDTGYEKQIAGSYFYNSNPGSSIVLKGFKKEDTLKINEYVDGKITGHFTIKKIEGDYSIEWKGAWTSAETKQKHEVEFTAVIY